MKTVRRVADPNAPLQATILDRLGIDTQRDVRARARAQDAHVDKLYTANLSITLGPFYRDGVTGTATYTTRLGIPTGLTVWGEYASPMGYRAARPGAVVRGYLWADPPWSTAGSIMLRVRVTDGAGVLWDYDLTDCRLDGTAHPEGGYTRSQNVSQHLPISQIIPVAQGQLVDCRVVATGYSPTSNTGMQIVVVEPEDIIPLPGVSA